MRVRTSVELMFSAALRLPSQTGPAKRVHGHNYRLQVTVDGEPDEAGLLGTIREAAVDRCDHHTLNDVMPDPTPGNLAKWFFAELQPKVPGLVEVALWQTPGHCVKVGS